VGLLGTVAVMAASLLLTACGENSADDEGTTLPAATTLAPTPAPTTSEPAVESTTTAPAITVPTTTEPPPSDLPYEEFDYDNFAAAPDVIDNVWIPLTPGTRFVYEGTTNEGELLPHTVIITVTDLVKVIDGVPSLVTWDLDYSDGELVEAELAFYAQDDAGAVWRMGEYPEEYEDGQLVEAPAWLAGVADARAGIAMHAEPQTASPSYSQGWGPAVEFIDRAQVEQTGVEYCTSVECYDEVVVIAEFNVEEEGAFQLKYFARDVGNIRVDWRGDDETQEELTLVELTQLTADELAEVRAEALALEAKAYEASEVYQATAPAEPR
jgi:hypothetical protein